MTFEEAASLLEAVRSGRRDLDSLTGEVVQELLFYNLAKHLFKRGEIKSAANYRRGPVDYVFDESSPSLELGSGANRRHYFEVKHYRRSLELDHVAKIMVIGVAEQPASLNVVSLTPLQPQVLDYARSLFLVDSVHRPIFSSVRFNHWETRKLIGFDPAESRAPSLNALPAFAYHATHGSCTRMDVDTVPRIRRAGLSLIRDARLARAPQAGHPLSPSHPPSSTSRVRAVVARRDSREGVEKSG